MFNIIFVRYHETLLKLPNIGHLLASRSYHTTTIFFHLYTILLFSFILDHTQCCYGNNPQLTLLYGAHND